MIIQILIAICIVWFISTLIDQFSVSFHAREIKNLLDCGFFIGGYISGVIAITYFLSAFGI